MSPLHPVSQSTAITCALQLTDKVSCVFWNRIIEYLFTFSTTIIKKLETAISHEVQWAGLDPLVGQFWPPGRMFNIPAIEKVGERRTFAKLTSIFCFSIYLLRMSNFLSTLCLQAEVNFSPVGSLKSVLS